MTRRCDVAVVGGGVAGLSAAAVAARAGADVVAVEAGSIGGRASTTERDGFRLNQGPHALYLGGAFQRLLASLGIVGAGSSPPLGRARVWSGGRDHPLPSGPASLARSRALGMRGKAATARVVGRIDRVDSAPLAAVPVDQWLDDQRLPPDAAALLQALFRLSSYSNAPSLLSSAAAIDQLRLALQGVRYLDRGFQQVVDGLAAVARTAGATVRQSCAASAVRADGASWVVTTGDGDVVASAVVLAAGGPATAVRLLGEDPAGWLGSVGPAVEAACLDLGVRRIPERPILLGLDEPLYLSTHAPPAALAPAGHGLVAVARYLRPGEELDPDTTRQQLREHAERAGVQDGDVVLERYLHRMTVAHGMPLAARGGLAGRPPVTVPGRRGLFVAGDWVGPTGMLSDASAASGAEAATAATRQLAGAVA